MIGGDIFRDHGRVAQLVLQALEKRRGDTVEIEDMRVRAGAAFAMPRAADAGPAASVRAGAGQGAAAGATAQEAGEGMPVTALLLRPDAGASINTFGSGANYFPGNAAGSAGTGYYS
jgi:hypothetical protein